ncbi:Magnesium transporter NIPA2 [Cyphellophora attinorum]|uniref:Magnesium transporter NIPA2 n=1 Tax=Cyphellophora attinorum TaxID=1664694 RepID=A0A0N1H2X3_9EURO|nr:Magnesium transporter NIPA2 [Phialophora attinorum]KPI34575.1 Magnesium transporter NIPA2 [Phialophora attinorum]
MNDLPADLIYSSAHSLQHEFVTRAAVGGDPASRPPAYRAVGLSLAIASGIFIGISFVLKKVGLLKANAKYNEEAGEGYGYLKNFHWWGGMTLMIIGEICNFVAYAFVDAILVTPLGALSVVVTTVLSAIFLKERLSFVGKVGCFLCIIGSIVIVMNAPEQSAVADIQQMQHFVIAPGFLSYAGVIIVGCGIVAFWVAPKYGKKSMLVYLSICSLIGGLSVVATQGLGSAVVAQAGGKAQFNQWFLYVLLVFVVATLLTEIIYLNKALNLFNAALVTPTYYVMFTSATIVTSAILFRGFHGTGVQIATVIMGFLVICSGVILLQMSKSAKDVPDAAVFKGDLDQIREIGEQEQPESEPKADALRGTSAIIRRLSQSRRKMEEDEADRLRRETDADHLEPVRENEVVEWDGLRRRKTVIGAPGSGMPQRRQTLHPPLGMSKFPDPEEEQVRESHNFFDTVRARTLSVMHRDHRGSGDIEEAKSPVPLTAIDARSTKPDTPVTAYGPGSLAEAEEHIYGLPKGLRRQQDKEAGIAAAQSPRLPQDSNSLKPHQEARRQFSFNNFWNRRSVTPSEPDATLSPSQRPRIASRASSHERRANKNATEEERMGLVKGDSSHSLLHYASPERVTPGALAPMIAVHSPSSSVSSTHSDEDYFYASPTHSQRPSQYRYPHPPPYETASDSAPKTFPTALPPAATRSSPNNSPPSPPPTRSYHQPYQHGGPHPSRPARQASPPLPPLPMAQPRSDTAASHASSDVIRPFPAFVDEEPPLPPLPTFEQLSEPLIGQSDAVPGSSSGVKEDGTKRSRMGKWPIGKNNRK